MKQVVVDFHLSLRPITETDLSFLSRVYNSTREDEMARSGWTQRQIDEFLEFQFLAQHRYYQEQFSEAQFDLVFLDGTPVGRLYVDRRALEIQLIDIALLPQFRGRGIGRVLVKGILKEAQMAAKPVRIHVEKNNPVLSFYEKLGFQQYGDTGVYYQMEWIPDIKETGAP